MSTVYILNSVPNVTEHSPSCEDNSRLASQILWNTTVRCRVHKSRPLDPITNQMYTVHVPVPLSFTTHFRTIPYTPMSPR
jgi:hypothetical protein